MRNGAGNFRGYRGSGSDITERKRAEEALPENEERLKEAARLANAQDGAVFTITLPAVAD